MAAHGCGAGGGLTGRRSAGMCAVAGPRRSATVSELAWLVRVRFIRRCRQRRLCRRVDAPRRGAD